ncbi:MAG: DUF4383 domain-containing protein [Candidatus Saccharimonadales bacterium]
MIKNLAILFGVVFLLVGFLGFIPALSPEHSDGMRYLLGIFMVGGVHNIIHLLSGALALAGGMSSEKYAQLYFRVFGSVYALVTVVGFIQKTTVLGIFHVNTADNFLHLVLAVAILGVGFGVKTGGNLPTRATV